MEDSGGGYDLLCDIFESANDILISRLGSTRHVPRFVNDFLVDGEELVEVVDCIREFLEEFRFSWSSFSSLNKI